MSGDSWEQLARDLWQAWLYHGDLDDVYTYEERLNALADPPRAQPREPSADDPPGWGGLLPPAGRVGPSGVRHQWTPSCDQFGCRPFECEHLARQHMKRDGHIFERCIGCGAERDLGAAATP